MEELSQGTVQAPFVPNPFVQAPPRPMPPTVGQLPLIGALPTMLWQQADFFPTARARYGDIYTLDLGLVRMVVLNHPRHAEHILRDRAANYVKGSGLWDMVRTILGNGLLVSEGDFWLRQRRMIQPQFHRQRLNELGSLMVEAIDEALVGWDRAASTNTALDPATAFSPITMKVIARTLFGSDIDSAEVSGVGESMAFALDYVFRGMISHTLPDWVPMPGKQKYQEMIRRLDAVLFKVIERRRDESSTAGGSNLLSMLMSAVDTETGERMTNNQLRDEAITFFLAGYETTSLALAWALQYLLRAPDLMAKLRAEVDGALGQRQPGFADLSALPYTRMVFQEALRIRSPNWWIPRVAVEDDVIDGYRIPQGTTVAALAHAVHHHPEFWPNPERFDPERFTPERSAQRHKAAWIPFGLGQHQCIGKEFVIMEGQLILARIMQRYLIHAGAGSPATPALSATLRLKGGVALRLSRREL